MKLRSSVIGQVLRLEQTSSSALKAILRLFKEQSKTLGNTSSALSFKSKIDLLLDLEEISKTEYSHLLKLMEIRNQFAHNPNAISFISFQTINKDVFNYLSKYIPNEANEEDLEIQLNAAFGELFKMCAGRLLIIEMEYTAGMKKQLKQHVNNIVIENIEAIWAKAVESHKMQPTPMYKIFQNDNDENLETLYAKFQIAMLEFRQEEWKKLEGNITIAFKPKETILEQLKNKEGENS